MSRDIMRYAMPAVLVDVGVTAMSGSVDIVDCLVIPTSELSRLISTLSLTLYIRALKAGWMVDKVAYVVASNMKSRNMTKPLTTRSGMAKRFFGGFPGIDALSRKKLIAAWMYKPEIIDSSMQNSVISTFLHTKRTANHVLRFGGAAVVPNWNTAVGIWVKSPITIIMTRTDRTTIVSCLIRCSREYNTMDWPETMSTVPSTRGHMIEYDGSPAL